MVLVVGYSRTQVLASFVTLPSFRSAHVTGSRHKLVAIIGVVSLCFPEKIYKAVGRGVERY